MLFDVKQSVNLLKPIAQIKLFIVSLLLIMSHHLTQAREIITLDSIVAVVNDGVITQLELKTEFRNVVQNLKKKQAKLPPANILGKQVLERMILEQIQLDLAQRSGIKVDDTTLSRAINRIAAQNGLSLSQFRENIAKQGMDFRQFRDEIKSQILLKRLLQRNVVNKVTISEQEIKNFLFNIDKQGGLEQAYHLQHILIAVPEGASPEVIKKAQNKAIGIVKELRSGSNFSTTALAISDGQNALEGGDLGWRKAGELPTLFAENVATMKVNEISDPIRSPSGFHIITLIAEKGGQSHLITQTNARHILIKTTIINDNERVIERLKQIRSRIINGEESFSTMAKAYSEDTSSATLGGDLGWSKPGTMVPEFEQAMDALEPGELSKVIRTNFGYHIIEVLGRRSHDDADEMIQERARQVLKSRKVAEQTDAFYRKIRDEAFVEIRLNNG
jgi:peptidyl-prolyl cis-trans isomerase SurA